MGGGNGGHPEVPRPGTHTVKNQTIKLLSLLTNFKKKSLVSSYYIKGYYFVIIKILKDYLSRLKINKMNL